MLVDDLHALNAEADALLATPPSLNSGAWELRMRLQDTATALSNSGEQFSGRMTDVWTQAMSYIDDLGIHANQGQARANEEARRAELAERAGLTLPRVNARHVFGHSQRPGQAPSTSFRSMGEFLQAVRDAFVPGGPGRDDRLKPLAVDGMGTGSGPSGGFAVPEQFSSALLTMAQAMPTALMPRTTIFPITLGDTIQLPVSAETSRANGSRWGGISSTWIAEAAEKPTSFPTMRQLTLSLNELAILVPVSDRLLRSGGSAIEQFVRMAAADELVFRTNETIIRGNGTGQGLGILQGTGLIVVPAESGQTTASVTLGNVNAMYSRLLPQARPSAAWLVNTEVLEQLEAMTVGGPDHVTPVYIPAMGGIPSVAGTPIALSPTPLLKGLPVIECEACSALGTTGDIILAALPWVASLTRAGGVQEDVSMHLWFNYDQTAFRFVLEYDCEPLLSTPITPAYGTAGRTLSAYVALAARP
jgi:HK97 family phage major capsid protein